MEGLSITILSAIALSLAAIAGAVPLAAAGNVLGFFRFGLQAVTSSSSVLPTRKRVWGTVYDSRTKRPLPFVSVRLIGMDKRLLEERVTDQYGRYAFLTTPASLMSSDVRIQIEAEQPGYAFPAHAQADAADSFLYGNLYYGREMRVSADTLISVDVPMDPVASDVVPGGEQHAPSVRLGLATAAMADAAFWIGLVAVPLAYVVQPNPFTLGFVFLYLGTVSLRVFGIAERPFGIVIDAGTGNAIPFALITVVRKNGERVGHAVSDERGRYVLFTPRGEHVVTVRTPANVQPPRSVRESVATRKGWLTREMEL